MTVIERIIDTAKHNNINQKLLAELLNEYVEINITKQTITDWKTGKSSSYFYCLPEIAYVLKTSCDYLLTGKESCPDNLSLNEKEIIDIYRSLPDYLQSEIAGYIKGFNAAFNAVNNMEFKKNSLEKKQA